MILSHFGSRRFTHLYSCCRNPRSVQLGVVLSSVYTTGVERNALWLKIAIRTFFPVLADAILLSSHGRRAKLLRCQCGREIHPFRPMGEIRRLRPAESTEAIAAESKWGIPQRFLALGIGLLLLAVTVAAVLGSLQYADHQDFLAKTRLRREAALHLPPWTAIQIYRYQIAPGIETTLEERFQGSREKMAVGMVIAALTGMFGLVFAAVGVVGLSRKKRCKT